MISILRTQLCTPNLKEKLYVDEEKQIIRLQVISQLTEDGTNYVKLFSREFQK